MPRPELEGEYYGCHQDPDGLHLGFVSCWEFILKTFPSGNSLFPDAEAAGFLSGNEEFFLLARKLINYEEAYLNTLTNNCAY